MHRYKMIRLWALTDDEYQCLKLCINVQAFRLLGIDWYKWVKWHIDFEFCEIVFEWE